MNILIILLIASSYMNVMSANAAVLNAISCEFESLTNDGVCGFSGDLSRWQLSEGHLRDTSALDGPDQGVENSGT